jgi:protein tyrosine/serine phosphatase
VVDLRRLAEREREPSRRPPGWAGRVIENDLGDEEGEPPHIVALRDSDLSIEAVHAYMHDYYANAPFEPRHIDLFTRYFEVLAEGHGPVIIHCAAGKDRTGLLAALTHTALGVSREDVVEDFLLTNQAARIEARAPEVGRRLAEAFGREPSEAAVRAFLGVEASYLETAFAAIEARHGDVDAYLEEVLGVTPERREALAARLLA